MRKKKGITFFWISIHLGSTVSLHCSSPIETCVGSLVEFVGGGVSVSDINSSPTESRRQINSHVTKEHGLFNTPNQFKVALLQI